jgi:hypothetical protein
MESEMLPTEAEPALEAEEVTLSAWANEASARVAMTRVLRRRGKIMRFLQSS